MASATTSPPAPAQRVEEEEEEGRRGRSFRARFSDTFDSLRVRDYRLLFQGNAVTSVGFWMQQAALGWL
ncbi:MAG TPA: MFS transporter, partial [Chloroflexota bacterium]|nr:MFS transporter [Chloroflexota bacterium]